MTWGKESNVQRLGGQAGHGNYGYVCCVPEKSRRGKVIFASDLSVMGDACGLHAPWCGSESCSPFLLMVAIHSNLNNYSFTDEIEVW